MDESGLVDFHFGLGLRIRNEFGLLSGNEELRAAIRGERLFGVHEDSMSAAIISALWLRLREQGKG